MRAAKTILDLRGVELNRAKVLRIDGLMVQAIACPRSTAGVGLTDGAGSWGPH